MNSDTRDVSTAVRAGLSAGADKGHGSVTLCRRRRGSARLVCGSGVIQVKMNPAGKLEPLSVLRARPRRPGVPKVIAAPQSSLAAADLISRATHAEAASISSHRDAAAEPPPAASIVRRRGGGFVWCVHI